MLGCIIGDLAGSRYEGCSQNPKDSPLFVQFQPSPAEIARRYAKSDQNMDLTPELEAIRRASHW